MIDRSLIATYRLQLGPSMTFEGAARLVHYLADLGVSHLSVSPVLDAVPGSTHGYDVVDHHRPNDDLGAEEGFRVLVDQLHAHGMGLVVDVVPNHMAAHADNRKWWDVLRFGRSSQHASWFDIDWERGTDDVPDRLLLAVLSDHYGSELRSGDIRLDTVNDALVVRYHDRVFPLCVASTVDVLRDAFASVGDERRLAELDHIEQQGTTPASHSDALRRLSVLSRCWYGGDASLPCGTTGIDIHEVLGGWNDDPERLHEVLERQHYRLARRRFFDVTELLGVRMEDPTVFESSHARLLQWVSSGEVDGFRIDHPDGLADPTDYFRRLRDAAPNAWIVVEKILEMDEELPAAWPVDGTTGYESSAVIDRVFVQPGGDAELARIEELITGELPVFDEVRRVAKQEVLDELLPAELRRLTSDLIEHCQQALDRVDVTTASAAPTIAAFLVEMPVHRTYARAGEDASATDTAVVHRTRALVVEHHPDLDEAMVDLVEHLLLGPVDDDPGRRFRRRFQQTSSPVMAKGVEDTAFYRYPLLVSLNEVGADPSVPSITVEHFHELQQRAAASTPRRMVGTSTHDSKRSEDVRARISVLSEVPTLWHDTVSRLDERVSALATGERDTTLEYLLHQTMFGAFPIAAERAVAYALKAAREAKRLTSWLQQDEDAEQRLVVAVQGWLADPGYTGAMRDMLEMTLLPGRINSIAAKLLALTVPGVPDLYQGSELYTDSLVDPDNRRPVDFDRRRAVLDALDRAAPSPGLRDDGEAKMRVVRAALAVRRTRPAAFGPEGSYEPVTVSGRAADHVIGFVRGGVVATVVPRLMLRLQAQGGWDDTRIELPPGVWVDRLWHRTWSGTVRMRDLLVTMPVALLERA